MRVFKVSSIWDTIQLNYAATNVALPDNNDFNHVKSSHKLMQYAQMGISVVAPNLPPYNEPPVIGKPALFYTRVQE